MAACPDRTPRQGGLLAGRRGLGRGGACRPAPWDSREEAASASDAGPTHAPSVMTGRQVTLPGELEAVRVARLPRPGAREGAREMRPGWRHSHVPATDPASQEPEVAGRRPLCGACCVPGGSECSTGRFAPWSHDRWCATPCADARRDRGPRALARLMELSHLSRLPAHSSVAVSECVCMFCHHCHHSCPELSAPQMEPLSPLTTSAPPPPPNLPPTSCPSESATLGLV